MESCDFFQMPVMGRASPPIAKGASTNMGHDHAPYEHVWASRPFLLIAVGKLMLRVGSDTPKSAALSALAPPCTGSFVSPAVFSTVIVQV